MHGSEMPLTATRGPSDSATGAAKCNEMLAGFIVWLARRRLPVGRRQELHRAVERFLRWPADPCQTPGDVTAYLQHMRQAGHSEAEVKVAGEAISALRVHLNGGAGPAR